MRLPLWIRRLTHNLSTIRPKVSIEFDSHLWSVGVNLFLNTAPGDKDYTLHFDSAGLLIDFGPLHLDFVLVDTD